MDMRTARQLMDALDWNRSELANQYSVSVGTIRKTQQMLVDDGLLIKLQGSGTFVSPAHLIAQPQCWSPKIQMMLG